ncbi:hypothetical protein ACEV6G_18030 [Enterobacter ludwigii]|jgi:hypothetical protein|uniref:hypothetical protein n=1 Tax=Enterobacter TaxID=547 RepID=UPI0005CFD34A|nr:MULTISPECIES: hypothetical protein [Enterobacter]EKS7104758.1 hypothetical protein [Enterobacter ludwigii]EKS7109221.1 hypothetical protein [Enterobacter ludwigii]MBO1468068.1 hypothetical protein [Enterobacter ludwigii]MBO1526715.1 hypothetical protein [Enterobacter ludwigii]MBQ0313206.1 hypothetical protein [Enterobacter ludwigii]
MKIVFIPALIIVLIDKEQGMGRELTRDEVESIRDDATAIRLPAEAAEDIIRERGYRDIDPENVWREWQAYKADRMSMGTRCFSGT